MYILRYNTIFPPDNERLCKEKPDDETIALQITAAKNYWGHQQKWEFCKVLQTDKSGQTFTELPATGDILCKSAKDESDKTLSDLAEYVWVMQFTWKGKNCTKPIANMERMFGNSGLCNIWITLNGYVYTLLMDHQIFRWRWFQYYCHSAGLLITQKNNSLYTLWCFVWNLSNVHLQMLQY